MAMTAEELRRQVRKNHNQNTWGAAAQQAREKRAQSQPAPVNNVTEETEEVPEQKPAEPVQTVTEKPAEVAQDVESTSAKNNEPESDKVTIKKRYNPELQTKGKTKSATGAAGTVSGEFQYEDPTMKLSKMTGDIHDERIRNLNRYLVDMSEEQYDVLNKAVADAYKNGGEAEAKKQSYKFANAMAYSKALKIPFTEALLNVDNYNRYYFGGKAGNDDYVTNWKAICDSVDLGSNITDMASIGNRIAVLEQRLKDYDPKTDTGYVIEGSDKHVLRSLYKEYESLKKVNESLQDGQTRNFFIEALKNAGQTLPYTAEVVAPSLLTSAIGLGPLGGIVVGYDLTYGTEYLEFREAGFTPEAADTGASISAAGQVAIENLLGNIAGTLGRNITKPVMSRISGKITANIANQMIKKGVTAASTYLLEAGEEGLEEALQSWWSYGTKYFVSALEDEGIQLEGASDVWANAFEEAKGAFLGSLVLGLPTSIRATYKDVQELKDIRQMSEEAPSKELFAKTVEKSKTVQSLDEAEREKFIDSVYEAGQKRAEREREADIEESRDLKGYSEGNETETDEEGNTYRMPKSGEYRDDKGSLHIEEDEQYAEESDGKTKRRVLLGDPSRVHSLEESGNRYGYIEYTMKGDKVTIDSFKMTPGRENLAAEFFRDVSKKYFVGKDVSWNPKHETNLNIKKSLVENNPTSKTLNYFASDEDVKDYETYRRVSDDISQTFKDRTQTAGATALTMAVAKTVSKRYGMTADEWIDNAFANGKILTQEKPAEFAAAEQQGMTPLGSTQRTMDFFQNDLKKISKALVYIGEHGDFNTYAHEFMHAVEPWLDDNDIKTIRKELGDDYHEKLADLWVDYIETGHSPIAQLENILKAITQFFKDLMGGLKRGYQKGDLKVNDDIKAIFDGLFDDSGENYFLKAYTMAQESERANASKVTEEAQTKQTEETTVSDNGTVNETENAAEQEASSTVQEQTADEVIASVNSAQAEKTEAALTEAAEDESYEIPADQFYQMINADIIKVLGEKNFKSKFNEVLLTSLATAEKEYDRLVKSGESEESANSICKQIFNWQKNDKGTWQYETDDSLTRILNTDDIVTLMRMTPAELDMFNQKRAENPLVLADILKADELYTLFPGLKNVTVNFVKDPSSSLVANVSTKGLTVNLLHLNENFFDNQFGLRGVLMHEIQHIIQVIQGEGLTDYNKAMTGKSLNYDKTSLAEGVQKSWQELEALKTQARTNLTRAERKFTPFSLFQIIGDKGALNIDRINEVHTLEDNLMTAIDMEANGRDKKNIRMATGWEKGADGKWRYEINDDYISFYDKDKYPKRFLEKNLEFNRIDEEIKKADYDFEKINIQDRQYWESVIDAENEYAREYIDFKDGKQIWKKTADLERIINAPELFDAYPELRKVQFKIEKLSDGIRGRAQGNTIILDESGTRRTLLHEIQHIIQHIEGFATGGSPEQFETKDFSKEKIESLTKKAKEIFDKQDENWKKLVRKYNEASINKDYETTSKIFDELENDAAFNEYAQLMSDAIAIQEGNTSVSYMKTPEEQYRSLAGEVEARSVETRIHMTPDERLQILLEESEDIDRDQQIIMYQTLKAESWLDAKTQEQEVIDAYKDTDAWLKAPNGKKSNLNEKQWVQVRTDNFKKWFGDWENDPENASKVLDENGEPKQDILFQMSAKTMYGIHNLSPEALRHVLKMGGLANPSIAVMDTEKGSFTSFGEISLIPYNYMLEKGPGIKGTYGADIYSPRYPAVENHITPTGANKIDSILGIVRDVNSQIGIELENKITSRIENNNGTLSDSRIKEMGLQIPFLIEKGFNDFFVHEETKFNDELLEKYHEYSQRKDYGAKLVEELYKIWLKEDLKNKGREGDYDEMIKDLIDPETGLINHNVLDSLDFQLERAYRLREKYSLYDTIKKAEEIITANNLDDEFMKYARQKVNSIEVEERIFNGYTASGNRRYLAHTLENVSRFMKAQGEQGAENFYYGLGSTRAKFTPRFTTLAQIKKARDRLLSHDEFERIKEDMEERFDNITDMLREDMDDDVGAARFEEAFTSSNPLEYIRDEYGINLSDDQKQEMLDFAHALKEMPTEYFEAKYTRPVYLNEFAGAVIPSNLDQDLKDALSNAGLMLAEYDGSENRAAVIKQALTDMNEKRQILFQSVLNADAIIDKVVSFADSGIDQKYEKLLGKVTETFVRLAKKYGEDIEGYSHSIDNFFIKHDRKTHGNPKLEKERGQIAISNDDYKRIPEVLNNPDYIIFGAENKQHNKVIIYAKNMDDGSTLYVEEKRTRSKHLAANTLYKLAAASNANTLLRNPTLYVQNDHGTIQIVDVKSEIVNTSFQKVYHGSGADFEKFDTAQFGLSGEGSMSFGYGTYFTDNEEIARDYATRQGVRNPDYSRKQILTRTIESDKETYAEGEKRIKELAEELNEVRKRDKEIKEKYGESSVEYQNFLFYEEEKTLQKDYDRAVESHEATKRLIAENEKELAQIKDVRNLYTVEIPDGGYIQWDKVVRKQTTDKVKRELLKEIFSNPNSAYYSYDKRDLSNELDQVFDYVEGMQLYNNVSAYLEGDQAASKFFHKIGYAGIKYPAGTIHGGGNGAYNYVIFNDDDIVISDHTQFQTIEGLLEEAARFDSWEEWKKDVEGYREIFGTNETNDLITENAEDAWYKTMWEKAHKSGAVPEYNDEYVEKVRRVESDEATESELDNEWFDFIQKDNNLDDFLRAIAFESSYNPQIDEAAPQDEDEKNYLEKRARLRDRFNKEIRHGTWRDAAWKARQTKTGEKVPITERARKTLITLMKRAKRDYRDLYADFMDSEQWAVAEGFRSAESIVKNKIASPDTDFTFTAQEQIDEVIADIDAMTPEQRRELVAGLDFDRLRKELKAGTLEMNQDNLERLISGYDKQIAKLNQEIENWHKQYDANAELAIMQQAKLEKLAQEKAEKIQARLIASNIRDIKIRLIKQVNRRVDWKTIDYETGRKIIAIQALFQPKLKKMVNRFLNTEVYLREAVSMYKSDPDYKTRLWLLAGIKTEKDIKRFEKPIRDPKTGKLRQRKQKSLLRQFLKLLETKDYDKWTTEEKELAAKAVPRTDWVRELDLEKVMQDREKSLQLDIQDEQVQKLIKETLSADLITMLDQKDLRNWTLEEMEALTRKVNELRKEGREKLRIKTEAKLQEAEQTRARITRIIKSSGIVINKDDDDKTKERKEKLISKFQSEELPKILGLGEATKGTYASRNEKKKGLFKRILNGYGDANVRRVARILDNGHEDENTNILFYRENECYNAEQKAITSRTKKINDKMESLKLTSEELFVSHTVPGIGTFTVDELLFMVAANEDEMSQMAVACGNLLTEDERKAFEAEGPEGVERCFNLGRAKLKQVCDYTENLMKDQPKLRGFLNAIQDDYAAQYERMNEVSIEEFNTPVNRVKSYVPMVRLESNGETNAHQTKADLLGSQAAGGTNWVDKGNTKNRNEISPVFQKPIEMGLFSTWAASVKRTEHFINYASFVRDMNRIYKGRDSSQMRHYIENRYGRDMLTYIDEYIQECANPDVSSTQTQLDRIVRLLRGKTAPAYLAWKMSSIIKQLCTSPWPFMQFIGAGKYLSAVYDFIAHKDEMEQLIKSKSAYMNSRTFDPIIDLVREQQDKSLGAKTKTEKVGQKISQFEALGMKGLEWVDWVCVAPGWLAAYREQFKKLSSKEEQNKLIAKRREQLKRFEDVESPEWIEQQAQKAALTESEIEEKAVLYADDITRQCQPSSRLTDLAPMFKQRGAGSELSKIALQFTTSLNVIWQNIRYDLPAAVRAREFKRIVGMVAGYVLAGITVGMVTEGSGDDDDKDKEDMQALRNILYYGTTQFTDAVPFLGSVVSATTKQLITGKKNWSQGFSDMFPGLTKVTTGMTKLTSGDWGKACTNFMYAFGLAMGLPVSGFKEALAIAGIGDGDGEFDFYPQALAGRRQ